MAVSQCFVFICVTVRYSRHASVPMFCLYLCNCEVQQPCLCTNVVFICVTIRLKKPQEHCYPVGPVWTMFQCVERHMCSTTEATRALLPHTGSVQCFISCCHRKWLSRLPRPPGNPPYFLDPHQSKLATALLQVQTEAHKSKMPLVHI